MKPPTPHRFVLAGPRAGLAGEDSQGVAAASPSPTAAAAVEVAGAGGAAGGAGAADRAPADERAWLWRGGGRHVCAAPAPRSPSGAAAATYSPTYQ